MIRLLPFLILTACATAPPPVWELVPLLPEPSQEVLDRQAEERRILNS